MDQLKKEVSQLIADNKLELALNKISDNDELFKHSKSKEVTLLMARLNTLNRSTNMGILSNSEQNRTRNQITNAILEICKIDATASISNIEYSKQNISLKHIKEALKAIKNKKGKIDYSEAIEVLSDLF